MNSINHRWATQIANREDFHNSTGNLVGRNGDGRPRGRLPAAWWEVLLDDAPTYTVTSYGTPIAWWSEALGWRRPDVKYSVTTSRHQSLCPVTETVGGP